LYISNKEMLTGPHAVSWFYIAGVEAFSCCGQTTYYSFEISVILQEMRSAWWHPALLMNECLVSMDHVVNSRRRNMYKGFSVKDIRFYNSALRRKQWNLA